MVRTYPPQKGQEQWPSPKNSLEVQTETRRTWPSENWRIFWRNGGGDCITNPNNALLRKIPENCHRLAFFDPPKMGNFSWFLSLKSSIWCCIMSQPESSKSRNYYLTTCRVMPLNNLKPRWWPGRLSSIFIASHVAWKGLVNTSHRPGFRILKGNDRLGNSYFSHVFAVSFEGNLIQKHILKGCGFEGFSQVFPKKSQTQTLGSTSSIPVFQSHINWSTPIAGERNLPHFFTPHKPHGFNAFEIGFADWTYFGGGRFFVFVFFGRPPSCHVSPSLFGSRNPAEHRSSHASKWAETQSEMTLRLDGL